MKLNRQWRGNPPQLATAGMIDVVFLLLIFFLVNSSFKPTERQIESQLTDPQAKSSVAQEEPLVIQVGFRGQLAEYRVGGQVFGDRIELLTWMKEWPLKSQTVIIEIPAACPVEVPIHLLNDCRRAGFESIAYLPRAERS